MTQASEGAPRAGWLRFAPVLRLRTWLVLTHLAVFALPVVALIGTRALGEDLQMQTRQDLEHQGALLAMHVAHVAAERPGLPLARLGLDDTLAQARAQTLAGARVVDRTGRVVASSGESVGEDLSDAPEVRAALAGGLGEAVHPRPEGYERRGDLSGPSRFAAVRVHVAVPIRVADRTVGAVLLSRTPREELQAFWHMGPRLGWGAAVGIAVAVGVALGAARMVSRSLQTLGRASAGVVSENPAAVTAIAAARESRVAEASALAGTIAELRERLRARLRYITDFAGNVSHEFKTPVASLRGSLELLRDEPDMAADQRARFFDIALADVDRLGRLVGGLLALARADEGGERAAVDLRNLATAVAARVPDISLGGDTSPCVVLGDARQLESALVNLLENARRHGGPAVRVRVWTDRASAGFDVEEDGPGISAANLPRIFDRFFTTRRDTGGTGLGLALVRAVAESHGGTATAESSPGRTVFRITLPRAP